MARQTQDESNSLNREELIQLAIKTARSGNKAGARVMFQRTLSEDPRNERALLWMASLTDSKADKRRFLLKTLKVNPDNEAARSELKRMARNEEASANRTLLYGGLFIGGALVIIAIVVVFALILSQVL